MSLERKIGELTIKMRSCDRGTTKPLIDDIEILLPNKFKTETRYIGIIDTGADITMVSDELVDNIHLLALNGSLFELQIRMPILFGNTVLRFEINKYKITKNNENDRTPHILLGRDFLSICKLYYDGLSNTVLIESFDVKDNKHLAFNK